MNTTYMILAGALILADLLVCMAIGVKTSGKAKSAEDYFIGGKKTGTFLLFLTAWASFSGAGNFIGQAGRGALEGISAYWLWLGEGLLGGIIMGYILAPYLARFKYLSMPHFISDYLFGGDHYIRRAGGLAALMPNVVWPGAQIMGVAYVLEQVFGIDYRIAVIVCGVVFIFYTVSGGLEAVIYAGGSCKMEPVCGRTGSDSYRIPDSFGGCCFQSDFLEQSICCKGCKNCKTFLWCYVFFEYYSGISYDYHRYCLTDVHQCRRSGACMGDFE